MPTDILYIRISCTSCHGSRIYSAGGYYDSMKPGKWSTCPYCDWEGMVYVEASVNVIVDYLAELPPEHQTLILQKLAQKKSEI